MSWNERFRTVQTECPSHQKKFVFLACLAAVFLNIHPGGFSARAEETGGDILRENVAASENGNVAKMSETVRPVTLTVSRLPVFEDQSGDAPADLGWIAANTTLMTSEELYRSQPRRFQEALRDAEGALFYDQVGNDIDTVFGLRGFSEGSSVVVLVDGVRVNESDGEGVNYPLLDFSHLDSVEIDRGSASPVYGSGAFGGVVRIRSGRPSKKRLSVFGGFELSSFRRLRFYDGISGTIDDRWTGLGGAFTYYFKGGRHVSDGFRQNGEYRITNFDAKAGYEFADGAGGIRLGVKHTDDAVSNPGELTAEQYHADAEKTLKPLDGRAYEDTIVQGEAERRFFDERLEASVLASWHLNHSDFYTTSVTFADGIFDPDTDRVTSRSRAANLVWQLAYRDEWKRLGHETVLGMEHNWETTYTREQDAAGGKIVQGSPPETERSADPGGAAFFWRETLKFFDRVMVHAGMRHDFESLKTRDALFPSADVSRRWRDSTVSTGVTVKPVRWADVFANYSQGFRVPTISEIAPYGSTVYTDLQTEKSDSYEAGTRLRMPGKSEAKFSYFLIDLKDEILFDSTAVTVANPWGSNTNVGKSRRTGIELRIDTRPAEELEFYGAYTWTKAFVLETDRGGALIDGRSLGQVPANRMAFGASLWPFKRLGEALGGLRFSMNGVFTGSQHPVSFESTARDVLEATGGAGHVIKSYIVWDFMAAYFLKGTEVYFKINNVFDAKYYSRAVNATVYPAAWGGATVLNPGTYTFVNPGPPREFLLGARWEI